MIRALKILFPLIWLFFVVGCVQKTPSPIEEYKLCTVVDRFQTVKFGTQSNRRDEVKANVFNTACKLKSTGAIVVTQNPIEFYAAHPIGDTISVSVIVDCKTYPNYDIFNWVAWILTFLWLPFAWLIEQHFLQKFQFLIDLNLQSVVPLKNQGKHYQQEDLFVCREFE